MGCCSLIFVRIFFALDFLKAFAFPVNVYELIAKSFALSRHSHCERISTAATKRVGPATPAQSSIQFARAEGQFFDKRFSSSHRISGLPLVQNTPIHKIPPYTLKQAWRNRFNLVSSIKLSVKTESAWRAEGKRSFDSWSTFTGAALRAAWCLGGNVSYKPSKNPKFFSATRGSL